MDTASAIYNAFACLASSSGLARVAEGTLNADETAAFAALSGSATLIQPQQVELLKQTGFARLVGLTSADTLGELNIQVALIPSSAARHTGSALIALQAGDEDTPIESVAVDLTNYVDREIWLVFTLGGAVDHVWTPALTESDASDGSYTASTTVPALADFANDTGSSQFVRLTPNAAKPFIKASFVSDTGATGYVSAYLLIDY